MDLWIAEMPGTQALGPLPAAVRCRTFARTEAPPAEALEAEFLVPSSSSAGLRELLAQMHSLRVLQTISAGVDWILPYVPAGVTLCSARGARDTAVAEWVLAAVLSCAKELPQLRDRQLEHRWAPLVPGDLAGATVTILGYGSIGAAVEARLAGFEVELLRVARHPREGVHGADELERLLPRTDVLIVLLPRTEQTRGLLDADLLGRLPEGALLVNAARGAVVDTDALVELVQAGRLRAALDVSDPEPLPADHPLWSAPGVLIAPHVAGDSPGAEERVFALVGEQVRRYVAGEPLVNVVGRGY
jgi:phosphoglycerate dehydrogenase-like enzyme